MASKLERLQTEIHYCHHCFAWIIDEIWENHCQSHIQTIDSKYCGTTTFCHTLVRPGYCPFCLGNQALPASQRLESWTRDHKLWVHVNEKHLSGCQWPSSCPHPLCNLSFNDEFALQFHLIDDHGFSQTRPRPTGRRNTSRKGLGSDRKRKSLDEDSTQWMAPGCPEKILAETECPSPARLLKKSRAADLMLCSPPSLDSEDRNGNQLLAVASPNPTETSTCLVTDLYPCHVGMHIEAGAAELSDVTTESFFSQYLRLPSPPCANADCEAVTEGFGSRSTVLSRRCSPQLEPSPSCTSAALSRTCSPQLEPPLHVEPSQTDCNIKRIRLRMKPSKPRIILHGPQRKRKRRINI